MAALTLPTAKSLALPAHDPPSSYWYYQYSTKTNPPPSFPDSLSLVHSHIYPRLESVKQNHKRIEVDVYFRIQPWQRVSIPTNTALILILLCPTTCFFFWLNCAACSRAHGCTMTHVYWRGTQSLLSRSRLLVRRPPPTHETEYSNHASATPIGLETTRRRIHLLKRNTVVGHWQGLTKRWFTNMPFPTQTPPSA